MASPSSRIKYRARLVDSEWYSGVMSTCSSRFQSKIRWMASNLTLGRWMPSVAGGSCASCRKMRGSASASWGAGVGMTPPAVAERMRRLEDAGIIRGYGVELDVERLGCRCRRYSPGSSWVSSAEVQPGHLGCRKFGVPQRDGRGLLRPSRLRWPRFTTWRGCWSGCRASAIPRRRSSFRRRCPGA